MTRNALSICLLLILGSSLATRAQSIFFKENFQFEFSADWRQESADNTSDGWRWGTALSLSSADFLIPDHSSFIVNNEDACRFSGTPSCNKADEWLYLPAIDFTGIDGIRLFTDVFFPGGTYGGATETASIQISRDSINWTPLHTISGDGDSWQTLVVDLSGYANESTVYLAYTYQDGGGWPYGLAIDNIILREVPARDIATTAVPFGEPYALAGPQSIRAKISNHGYDTINSLRLHYQIDDEAPIDQLFTGLVLPPLGSVTLEADQAWEAAAAAETYTLTIWASEPNGLSDETIGDNHDILEVGVIDPAQTAQRTLLMEHFTSTNSDSCGTLNPLVQNAMDESAVPVLALRYHTWWPTPTDPFYLANPVPSERRIAYYGIDAVPSVFVSGDAKAVRHDLGQDSLSSYASLPSPIRLEGEWIKEYDGSYTARIKVTTLASHWMKKLRLLGVVSDAFVPGPNPDLPVYQNSETAFHDLVLDMLPQPSGVALQDSIAGATTSYEWNWKPNAAAENADDLQLTLFVQDNKSRLVLQAARFDARVSGLPAEPNQATVQVHPNPATQWAKLVWDLPSAEGLDVQILDAMGRVHAVLASGQYASGKHELTIDLSGYPKGMYWVSLRGTQSALTLPLQVMP